LVARREILVDATEAEASSAVVCHGPSAPTSHRSLEALIDAVDASPDQIRSPFHGVERLWPAVTRFLESEDQEPPVTAGDNALFERWAEENLLEFQEVQRRVRRIGEACVSFIRLRGGRAWTLDSLSSALSASDTDDRSDQLDSLEAPGLCGEWLRIMEDGVGDDRIDAALALLRWSRKIHDDMTAGRWPPPWV
jgi:hypothetical protein